jgi:hypothetical protein
MNKELRTKGCYFIIIFCLLFAPAFTRASTLNPFSSDFKLSICDGPTLPNPLPAGMTKPAKYVPCDFNGLITQTQFLINAMIMLGVLAAVVSFSYAGYLYITGVEKNISDAKEIFKKTIIGLIMMLGAWFIVFQLLDWLANSGAKTLLGGIRNPS